MISSTNYISSWSQWISIQLRHKAPGLKTVDQIAFEPGQMTLNFLNRINAHFKKYNDSYTVFINNLKSAESAVNLRQFPNKLCFEGIIKNQNFVRLTDTTETSNRLEVSYINNLNTKPLDNFSFALHKGEVASPKDFEVLELTPLKHFFVVEEKISAEEVTFFDFMLHKIDGVKVVTVQNEKNQTKVNCDFSNCGEGAYLIKIKNKEAKKVYASEKKQINIVVECFSGQKAQKKPFWDGKAFGNQDMYITFDTRDTYWKYILVSRSPDRLIYDIEEVQFELNSEVIKSEKIVQTELVNGVKCLHVTLTEPQKLRINTFNHEILKMKINKAKKWNLRSLRMPIPTYKNVQRPDSKSGKVFTLIYVYI